MKKKEKEGRKKGGNVGRERIKTNRLGFQKDGLENIT